MKIKKLSKEQINDIKNISSFARGTILKMTTNSMSGHPGGSMSSIDILLTLYKFMEIDPQNPYDEKRDRLIVSNGHISPAVYTTLGINNFFPLQDAITEFRLAGSIYEGHIETEIPGIEWCTGNLGQGLSAGCGFALGCKLKNIDNDIFVLMGDGEQQKGQLSEARKFAVKYKLNNITAIIDYNKLQIGGKITKVMPQKIKENYISDGWDVIEIDGHNFEDIGNALIKAKNNNNPTVILANTIMGSGVSFMENKEKYHGSTLNEDLLDKALKELNQDNDFKQYKELRNKLILSKDVENKTFYFNLNTPKKILYTEKNDNRSAWGNALANLAKENLNSLTKIAVFDCDLQGSVKTDKFEEIMPNNFFQGGIMEHNTATLAGALSYEGIQTFFSDFGIFGIDEVFNQQRLNDINNTNLKVVTTHVGIDVGEDGRTHHCINYLGLMKNLFNFPLYIPADPNQTDRLINYIGTRPGNCLITMGRSKIDIVTKEDGTPFFDLNYNFEPGKEDLIRKGDKLSIIAMGTTLNNALKAVDKLKKENINCSLYNVSSPTLINDSFVKEASKSGIIITVEDHNINTGLGNSIANKIVESGISCKLIKMGIRQYACSGSSKDLYKRYELDTDSIYNKIKEQLLI